MYVLQVKKSAANVGGRDGLDGRDRHRITLGILRYDGALQHAIVTRPSPSLYVYTRLQCMAYKTMEMALIKNELAVIGTIKNIERLNSLRVILFE